MKLPKHISTKFVALILLFAVIGAVGITQSFATSDDAKSKTSHKLPDNAAEFVALYTSPSEITSSQGQEFVVEVRVDTAGVAVNAVDATLTYQPGEVEFVRIDAADSDFDVSAQESGGDGVVSIARGYTGATSGDLRIANVVFRALTGDAKTSIDVANTSVVVDAEQFVDVLQKTMSSSVQLTQ